MEEGSIIKVAFPQADGIIKFRPAVLIKKVPPYNDLMVCAVSTQIQTFVPGLDLIIQQEEKDFGQTRLKQSSIIRVAKLTTIPIKDVEGTIGNIGPTRYKQILVQLNVFLR
jgi:mRNA interferase MazF